MTSFECFQNQEDFRLACPGVASEMRNDFLNCNGFVDYVTTSCGLNFNLIRDLCGTSTHTGASDVDAVRS